MFQIRDQIGAIMSQILASMQNIKPVVNVTVEAPAGPRDWPAYPDGEEGELEGLAEGGPVRRGVPYVVGERGPELFVPRYNGLILPSAQPAYAGGGGGSAIDKGPVQINVKIGEQTLMNTIVKKSCPCY